MAISMWALWLPMIVSAVFVFIASCVLWMFSPLHKQDYKDPGKDEAALLECLRRPSFTPGVYFVPWAKGWQKDPQAVAKRDRGPWALVTVMPKPSFRGNLVAWGVHQLVIAMLVAYSLSLTFHTGTQLIAIARGAATVGLVAHGGYAVPLSIWHGVPWKQLPGRLLDAAVYTALTAGTFVWFWPRA